jgi:hypothetical protein
MDEALLVDVLAVFEIGRQLAREGASEETVARVPRAAEPRPRSR